MIHRLFEWFYPVPLVNASWSAAEYGAALKSALFLRFLGNRDLVRLEEKVKDRIPASRVWAFENGRSALKWILDAARARPEGEGKDRVVLPSFCCRAVVDAVRAASLTPVLCDITEDLAVDPGSAEAVHDPEKTLAFIVPHLYGWPTPLDPFLRLVEGTDTLVIDDAAAAMGGKQNGIPLGLGGHAGIYSFSQGKAAVAGGGGLLLLPQQGPFSRAFPKDLAPMMQKKLRGWRVFCSFCWNDLFHKVSGPLKRCRQIGLARIGFHPKGGPSRVKVADRAMAGLQAAVALVQVERLEELSRMRRRNMMLLREELQDLQEIRMLPVPDGVTPTRFALETVDLEVKRSEAGIHEENPLARDLRSQGIEARYPYLALHAYKDAGELDTSMLKMSHRLSQRMLLLPFLPPLGPGEMARIGRAVRSFFGR